MICPQCKNKRECDFCESTGEVSEQLEKLYLLGFRFKQKFQNEYRIYLQKALNQYQTISVDIVKENGLLQIASIDSSGPYVIAEYEQLDSIEKIINYLRQA